MRAPLGINTYSPLKAPIKARKKEEWFTDFQRFERNCSKFWLAVITQSLSLSRLARFDGYYGKSFHNSSSSTTKKTSKASKCNNQKIRYKSSTRPKPGSRADLGQEITLDLSTRSSLNTSLTYSMSHQQIKQASVRSVISCQIETVTRWKSCAYKLLPGIYKSTTQGTNYFKTI